MTNPFKTNYMKKILQQPLVLTIVACTLLVFSCKKDDDASPEIVSPIADSSLPSGGIMQVQVLSKSSTSIDYSVDVCIFRDSKHVENQLKQDNFLNDTLTVSGTKYYFSLQSANVVSGAAALPYNALLLMDQSGSIVSTDPSNYRISAAKAFCNNLAPGDNASIWSFAASSIYYSKDLVQHSPSFSNSTSTLIPLLDALKGKANGNTPLYFAQSSVTDYCAANGQLSNKAVLTFTDGIDNGTLSGYSNTSAQVISNAKTKGVKLYNIGLDQAEVQNLCTQAIATGGAFMFAKDARQLISMFGNLGGLLNRTATYYHTVWRVTRSSGTFSSGNLTHQMPVSLPYGGKITVPFNLGF